MNKSYLEKKLNRKEILSFILFKQMLNQSVLNIIECAIPHSCAKLKDESKRCAQCEISRSFIACEPVLLKCGHHICQSCENKAKNGSLKCKICGLEIKSIDVKNNSAESLIEFLIDDLTKDLKDKYKKAFNLYAGLFSFKFIAISKFDLFY
jgi:hypothetical protein